MYKNILITGCAGDISQSISKILKVEFSRSKIYGIDIHDDHPGSVFYDASFVISRVTSAGYMKELRSIIKKLNIDLIIPASEPELRFFSEQNVTDIDGVPLIMANSRSMDIGFDKFKTYRFLKQEGLPFPVTYITGKLKKPYIPCIIKSRTGSGSKTLVKVENEEDFNFYKKKYPSFICQQYLLPDDAEYTCGLYRSARGDIRSITFKRQLQGGLSGKGVVVDNPEINGLLIKVAEKLELSGSINVQLRLTDNGPFIFEINPRFSSTVLFRHLLGFSDVVWSIEEKLGKKLKPYKPPVTGSKFYKISGENIQV